MFFSSMSFIANDEDEFVLGDHSDPSLEDVFSSHESIGSKNGDVFSTITSRVPSSSYEDGEDFSITMAHLGLLFHILTVDYNLHSKFMFQDPSDSLGVTYSQAFTVSLRHGMCGSNFSHGILFGSKFNYEEYHFLSHQCISIVLHSLRIHHTTVPELIEHIPLLPKKKIPPDIF